MARTCIFPPEKLFKLLVFTEFGLFPISAMPWSTELLLSPAKPFKSLRIRVSKDDAKDAIRMGKNNRGCHSCHCKKTGCLKRYCECFQAKVLCSENFKCVDCKNYGVCCERMALSGKDYDQAKSCESFEGSGETMAVSCGYNSNTNISLYLEGCEQKMAVSAGDKNHKEICIQ